MQYVFDAATNVCNVNVVGEELDTSRSRIRWHKGVGAGVCLYVLWILTT